MKQDASKWGQLQKMSCFCLPTSHSLQAPDNQEQDGGVDMNWWGGGGDGKALTLCSAVPLGFQALKKNLKNVTKYLCFSLPSDTAFLENI